MVVGSISFVYCFRLNIFTSNISNLLLPLWDEKAEETGGSESYPTNDMPNEDIYDAFLMIHLSASFLFFHFFLLQRS